MHPFIQNVLCFNLGIWIYLSHISANIPGKGMFIQ